MGIFYAGLYLLLSDALGVAIDPLSAMLFGLVTVVVPWFLMQPAMGLGVMARRTRRPAVARGVTVTSHGVFGLGLYLGVWLLRLA